MPAPKGPIPSNFIIYKSFDAIHELVEDVRCDFCGDGVLRLQDACKVGLEAVQSINSTCLHIIINRRPVPDLEQSLDKTQGLLHQGASAFRVGAQSLLPPTWLAT